VVVDLETSGFLTVVSIWVGMFILVYSCLSVDFIVQAFQLYKTLIHINLNVVKMKVLLHVSTFLVVLNVMKLDRIK